MTSIPAPGYQDGAQGAGDAYPLSPAVVLASTAAASGVPTPSPITPYVVTLTPPNTSVMVMNPNSSRVFLLLYNPTQVPMQFFLGSSVTWGTIGPPGNLSIGPGEAYFQATAQGLLPAYGGPIAAVSLFDGLPLWAWEA